MYQRILVPIDGSDTATRGLLGAITLAQNGSGRLRVVHVAATPAIYYSAGYIPADDFAQRVRAEGQAALDEAEALVRKNGLTSDFVLLDALHDNIGPLIVQQAQEWPADLIAMGTHGRRGLGRLVLGSEAE